MLRPESMSRLTVVGHKDCLQQTISELHGLKVLHIEDHTKNELADIGSPFEKASGLSEALLKIRSIISFCNIKEKNHPRFDEKPNPLKIDSKLQELGKRIGNIQDSARDCQSRLVRYNLTAAELKKLEDLEMPLGAISTYKSLAYFVGYVNDAIMLQSEIEKEGWNFQIYLSRKNPKLVVLFIESSKVEQVNELLGQSQFSSFNIPALEGLKGSPAAAIANISKEIFNCSNELERLNKELAQIGEENEEFLLAAEGHMSRELEKAEAPLRFAATKDAFVIKGWVPTSNISMVTSRLEKSSKNKLFISSEVPKPKDDVPVKLDNKKFAKPFEFLLEIYSLPIYKEFDPTFLVFLTFPLFFGFMLGDFGYGLITLGIFMLLRKKMPKAKNFFNIFILSSISSIIFGLLFGEFFGAEEIGHFELPHILSRSHDVMALLYLAVAIGIIHLNIGLILGFLSERKSHGLMHAFYAKLSWIILQLGVGLIAAHYLGFGISKYAGYAIASLALVLIIKGEGVRGAIELPSIFTNMLSYSRLMAIGLSSVMLAIVINEMAFGLINNGSWYIIVGILILFLGHTINIALGLMGSFLHSLRLHYVEFFTKFFHGGGKKYSPFGMQYM